MRRVVVTGLGVVSPLGDGVKPTWDRLISGKSGIRKITEMDVSDLPAKIAGFVPIKGTGHPYDKDAFEAEKYLSVKDQRKVDRFIVYGIAAATQAIEDSGWAPTDEESLERTGVIIGSGIGGLDEIYKTSLILKESGPRRVSPFFIPSCLINLTSGHVSIKYGFKGPNHSVVTACATGAHAIGDASRIIMFGDADVMVAGGSEAAICRLAIAGFSSARALSTKYNETPEQASRPWDEGRDGFVMGEGAGVVILEEYEHAKRRGAKIYAEIVGYGMSGDAHHITAPAEDGNGGYRAMKMALKNASMNPESLDYINAHGTATMGDTIEMKAVKQILGAHAGKASMSSTKSAIGHLLGAAGSVEAIFSILALNNQIVPPTLNLHNPAEGCDGIDLVPLKARERSVNAVMSNSFGFGGTNASLIFKKI